MDDYALVLNAGSSSLKFCVYRRPAADVWRLEAQGQIEGIGTSPRLSAKDGKGATLADDTLVTAVRDGRAASGRDDGHDIVAYVVASFGDGALERIAVDFPDRPVEGRALWGSVDEVAAATAEFFAAGADKRTAAQSGMRGAVTVREADDLVRDAGVFLDLVAARLGLPPFRQTMLPIDVASVYPARSGASQ